MFPGDHVRIAGCPRYVRDASGRSITDRTAHIVYENKLSNGNYEVQNVLILYIIIINTVAIFKNNSVFALARYV